ncbi:MAG: hypothetical protein LQ351_001370 [Letrouitia transgressa]|nr:MAG: hypothetical protein LQ351_001370 [Letrouitia transgressa]
MHGELRADAFHFNKETGVVKIVNFGSGPRSFEHAGGLTSVGWSALSRQTGIKNRIRFIAPEQTGRMPAEPDSRTDIYSLGILFWTMLTGEPAFDGITPMEIMQAVLGKRLAAVSTIRYDIPDVLSSIIQKMTQKQIDERYHSTSGLKYDLVQLRKHLGEGDVEALKSFQICTKDISSFFMLPTGILGRSQERKKIVEVMEKVIMKQQAVQHSASSIFQSITSTSASTISDRVDNLENGTKGSDSSSQAAKESEPSPALHPVAFTHEQKSRLPSNASEQMDISTTLDKPPLETNTSKESIESAVTADSQATGSARTTSQWSRGTPVPTPRWSAGPKFSRRRRCEVITIYGSAGLGKSSLIQDTQNDIRKVGYFASAKFDPARKAPFEPMLRAMSSLFRQIFSESDVHTVYHNHVRASIRPFWPSVCGMLDLPENLIATESLNASKSTTSFPLNKSVRAEMVESGSTYSGHSSNAAASQTTSEIIRGGTNSRSTKFLSTFLDVMRIVSASKPICVCLDDLQYADEESLDLISNVITRKLGILMIITCREQEHVPTTLRSLLENGTANLTTLQLSPLSEEQIIDFIVATLHRTREYVLPLAVVCLERTHGVFAEFETESYGDQLNTSFILRRLQDLPPAARAILAWGSLLGNTFSFALVQRLLGGEFDFGEDENNTDRSGGFKDDDLYIPQPVENAVEGLQAALQAYILMPSADEDKFRACLDLMQDEPWTDGPDVYYEETLDVHSKAAELHWHQGQFDKSLDLVSKTLQGARTASDRAPSWIIKSRLLSQEGNVAGAFEAELGVDCDSKPSLEALDSKLDRLRDLIRSTDASHNLHKPLNKDPRVVSLGAVLIEATSAAFWSDALLFYQLVIKMVDVHLKYPQTFSQIGLGFSYFSMVNVIQKSDIAFAIQCINIGAELLGQFKESYTYGRALSLRVMFIESFCRPMREHIGIVEEAIDHSLISGDKHLFLLSIGLVASCRLFQGDDMMEIDNYCSFAAEDYGDWSKDLRGGTYLTAVR